MSGGGTSRAASLRMKLALTALSLSGVLVLACSATSTPYGSAPSVEEPVAAPAFDASVAAKDATSEDETTPATDDAPRDAGTATPNGLATCCGGQGSCVPADAVPAESSDKLKADTCAETYLCAPAEVIAAGKDYVPASCEASGFGVKGAGVCLSECLNLGAPAGSLKQGSCKDAHVCVPCKAFGKATGAPGCPAQ